MSALTSAIHSCATNNPSMKIYHINVRAIHLCTSENPPIKVYHSNVSVQQTINQ